MRIEKISAVTLRVLNMKASLRFYGDVLGMEIVYGGEDAFFSSLRASGAEHPILSLEQGRSVAGWGARKYRRESTLPPGRTDRRSRW
jgi:catechol 2,3-dioxygenase-like lactoylglutathione lyase family enzyme